MTRFATTLAAAVFLTASAAHAADNAPTPASTMPQSANTSAIMVEGAAATGDNPGMNRRDERMSSGSNVEDDAYYATSPSDEPDSDKTERTHGAPDTARDSVPAGDATTQR